MTDKEEIEWLVRKAMQYDIRGMSYLANQCYAAVQEIVCRSCEHKVRAQGEDRCYLFAEVFQNCKKYKRRSPANKALHGDPTRAQQF